MGWRDCNYRHKYTFRILLTNVKTLTKLKLQSNGSGRVFEGNVQYIKVYDSATDF